MDLSRKEVAFLIEAARYWQRDMDQPYFVSTLTEEEIDDLCERMNMGEWGAPAPVCKCRHAEREHAMDETDGAFCEVKTCMCEQYDPEPKVSVKDLEDCGFNLDGNKGNA